MWGFPVGIPPFISCHLWARRSDVRRRSEGPLLGALLGMANGLHSDAHTVLEVRFLGKLGVTHRDFVGILLKG